MSERSPHVLVIDDDQDIHHALSLILGSAGFRVSCHATGAAGLAAARAEPPDLLLLDIMLSTPTEGFEIAAIWKADGQLKGIPIVLISSIGPSLGTEYAHDSGADMGKIAAFLEKPLSAQQVLATIREVMQRGASTE